MLQKDYKTRQVGTHRPKKVLGTFTYAFKDFYPLTVPLSYVAFLTKCVVPPLSSAKLSLGDKKTIITRAYHVRGVEIMMVN